MNELLVKKNMTADEWEALYEQNKATADNLPEWAKNTLSRAEQKASLVIDGVVFRPYCRVTHERHAIPVLFDFETAHEIAGRFNCFKRQTHDRAGAEVIVYSAFANTVDRR